MSDSFQYSIDIGACVSRSNDQLKRIYCLDNNNLNYCCGLNNLSTLLADSGERTCCSIEDYSDKQWVVLAIIESFSHLLLTMFLIELAMFAWFYYRSYRVNQSGIEDQRREVIKHLLKNQILHKSRRGDPSAITSLRHLSDSLTSSIKKRKMKKKSDERKKNLAAQNKSTQIGSHIGKKLYKNSNHFNNNHGLKLPMLKSPVKRQSTPRSPLSKSPLLRSPVSKSPLQGGMMIRNSVEKSPGKTRVHSFPKKQA